MSDCTRTYGEGLYNDCLYGGAEVIGGGCEDCTTPDPCSQQAPNAAGPDDRITVVVASDRGEC